VDAVVEAHPVAAHAHDQGVRPGRVGHEPHAAQEVAVRDARRDEDHVSSRKVLLGEHVRDVDADLTGLLDLRPRGRPQLGLDPAAEASERRGGEDGLPCAADADREVVVRSTDRGGDGRGHRAVADQLDPGARASELLDQVVVPRPVEHEGRDVERLAAEALRDVVDVICDRPVEIDHGACPRTDGDRAHVHVRQLEERALGRDGEHRHRPHAAPCDDAATLDRVEGQVDTIAVRADRAAREERLARTRADHDLPVDRQLVERRLHAARRGLLRRLLVRAAQPAGAGQRRPFSCPGVPGAETVGHPRH
jgi:hypothetical protein